jgi:hypothetical protein
MTHEYELDLDEPHVKRWRKVHEDGYETVVEVVEKAGEYELNARTLNPRREPYKEARIGRSRKFSEAKDAADKWMQMRPHGVEDHEADHIVDTDSGRGEMETVEEAYERFFGGRQ